METNLVCLRQSSKRHTLLRINRPLKYTLNTLQALLSGKGKHALNRFKTSGLNLLNGNCAITQNSHNSNTVSYYSKMEETSILP